MSGSARATQLFDLKLLLPGVYGWGRIRHFKVPDELSLTSTYSPLLSGRDNRGVTSDPTCLFLPMTAWCWSLNEGLRLCQQEPPLLFLLTRGMKHKIRSLSEQDAAPEINDSVRTEAAEPHPVWRRFKLHCTLYIHVIQTFACRDPNILQSIKR